jgi:YbgC/YbaW family acyl-CoA thioester hydrolase
VDQVIATTSHLRVRPRHCDAQAMVHASRYYEFFEDAFLDWLDEHAGGYRHLRCQDRIDFVIVASGCEYRQPARLDDELTVESRTERVGRTSLTVRFTVRRGRDELAVGHSTYVAVRDGTPAPLPSTLR